MTKTFVNYIYTSQIISYKKKLYLSRIYLSNCNSMIVLWSYSLVFYGFLKSAGSGWRGKCFETFEIKTIDWCGTIGTDLCIPKHTQIFSKPTITILFPWQVSEGVKWICLNEWITTNELKKYEYVDSEIRQTKASLKE